MGLVGAVLGLLIGLLLEWYTSASWCSTRPASSSRCWSRGSPASSCWAASVAAATLVGLWPAWCATRLRIPEAIAYE